MLQLFMVKVLATDDGGTAWFFVSAESEEQCREFMEDDISRIVELISGPVDIAAAVRREFDHVALVCPL